MKNPNIILEYERLKVFHLRLRIRYGYVLASLLNQPSTGIPSQIINECICLPVENPEEYTHTCREMCTHIKNKPVIINSVKLQDTVLTWKNLVH